MHHLQLLHKNITWYPFREEFRYHVEKLYSVLLVTGLGNLAKDSFRVGHMGYIAPHAIIVTISAIEHSLNDFTLPGKGRKAHK